jgi:hypothetical protein
MNRFQVVWLARRLAVVCALLAALAAAPAFAGAITIDGRTVAIPVPDGYCALDPALTARLPGNAAGAGRAVYMVDCSDLASLRYGSPTGAHLVMVQAPPEAFGFDRVMTRAAAARRFNERIVAPNVGGWAVIGNSRLNVLAANERGRDDETVANAQIEYMSGRNLVRQGIYLAATALNGVPVLVGWTWPSGRDEAAATGPRLLAYLDDLKARNPDVSRFSGWFADIGWRSILFPLLGVVGLALRFRRMFAA